MAQFARKVMWSVNMTTRAIENRIRDHALAGGADAVCIRTSNKGLEESIPRFHAAGLKVYGWRWPAVEETSAPHHFAPMEAQHVALRLVPAGLDGYIVDPEADTGRSNDNWNRSGLEQLAADFCEEIRAAGGTHFPFGVTSGCIYPNNRRRMPWAQFVAASDALFPQTYWRALLGTPPQPTGINGGTPLKAATRGLSSWETINAGKPIIPMAGEIELTTIDEIEDYGIAVKSLGLNQFHFYADNANVGAAKLAAIAAI